MLVITLSTWTTNDLNLHNGGRAMTNLFPRLGRWANTAILGAVGAALSMLRITEHFTALLELLVFVFAPLVAVSLADHDPLRERRLDPRLQDPDGGSRIFARGINLVAWAAVIAGGGVAYLAPDRMPASLIAFVIGGAMYYAGMKKTATP